MLLLNLKQVATLQDRYFKPEGTVLHDHNYTANLPDFSPGIRTRMHKMSINRTKLDKSAGKKIWPWSDQPYQFQCLHITLSPLALFSGHPQIYRCTLATHGHY